MLGASVGQYGGCLRYKNDPSVGDGRCSSYSNGYMVQLLTEANKSWPNAGHRLENGAASATPPQNLLGCLFSFLSPLANVIVLEFGSMAGYVELKGVEMIVRTLLSLPSQPALVFLSVRNWCKTKNCHHPLGANISHWVRPRQQRSPYSDVERSLLDLCRHYDLSCLSQFDALSPLVYSGKVSALLYVC